jgi:PPOX class probable F420-dependent enzyme
VGLQAQEATRVIRVAPAGAGALNLKAGEARRRFGTAAVARLATLGPAGRPHLVPVTFALDGDRIYTIVDGKPKTTANLARLRNIAADPRVTVLADHYEDDWDRLWWARADGLAVILRDPADMAGPVELLAARYPRYRADPPAGPLIRIQAERWTGWEAVSARGSDPPEPPGASIVPGRQARRRYRASARGSGPPGGPA